MNDLDEAEWRRKIDLAGYPAAQLVVLKEQGHGLINAALLGAASKCFEGKPWYVCTKQWSPDWIKALPKLELLVIQPEGAHRASYLDGNNNDAEVNTWLVQKGIPTRRALLALKSLRNSFPKQLKAAPIAIMPSRTSILLSFIVNNQDFMYSYVGEEDRPPKSFAPRTSVFFAAFVHYLQQNAVQPQRAFRKAVLFSNRWIDKEADRFTAMSNWKHNDVFLDSETDPNGAVVGGKDVQDLIENEFADPNIATTPRNREEGLKSIRLNSGPTVPDLLGRIEFDRGISKRSITEEWDHQEQSFCLWPRKGMGFDDKPKKTVMDGFGVIKKRHWKDRDLSERFLDLWRPCTEIEGCIACMRSKRNLLVELNHQLENFNRPYGHRTKAFYICDDPGGGKTTLVRHLANKHGMLFVSLNITEMFRREDLLGAFDQVVTTQAQNPGRSLLVFVDEVNADLAGHSVYSSFLTALDDGHYSRDGKAFVIAPCVWVFVGTSDISKPYSYQHTGPAEILDKVFFPPGWQGRSMNAGTVWSEYGVAAQAASARQSQTAPAGQQAEDRARKISDFQSRLTLRPFILNAMRDATKDTERLALLLQRGRGLERVYIGASIIKDLFPDVNFVSKRVLASLAMLPDTTSLRDIRHEFEQSIEVQRGFYRWHNLPGAYRKERFGRSWIAEKSDLSSLQSWSVAIGMLSKITEGIDEDRVELMTRAY